MKPGKIIVFEGLDYSFKETNSKKLFQYIKENITEKVILLSFPNYESDSSYFVKRYLNGDYGNDVDEYKASIFYLVDRYDTIIKENINQLVEEGYIIILDRYTGSNLIFQTAKIDKNSSNEIESNVKKMKFIKWVKDMEYNIFNLPKENVVIYMNMPLEVSYELMKQRKLKNNEDNDIHEDNRKFLEIVENNALSIANSNLWNIVNCTDNELNIKDENTIFNEVLDIVKKYITN